MQTPLFQALSSLDLNRRVISLGLDGSLCYAPPEGDESILPDDIGTRASSLLEAPPSGETAVAGRKRFGLAASDHIQSQHFARCILWRVYLGILPLPHVGTSLEHIVSPWCDKIYRLRALYATNKQAFHACYPAFGSIDVSLDDEFAATSEEGTAQYPPGCSSNEPSELPPQQQQGGRRSSSIFNVFRRSVNSATNLRKTSIGKGVSPLERCSQDVADDIISLDIRRTYLRNDPEVPHHMLFHILSLWRWMNPTIGYHQGMHEIAGYCLQVLSRGALGAPEGCPPEVQECVNPVYREADAFFLFDSIMNHFGLAELYVVSTVIGDGAGAAASLSPDSATQSSPPATFRHSTTVAPVPPPSSLFFESTMQQTSAVSGEPSSSGRTATTVSALEDACEYVVYQLLRDHSSELYHHLANTNMFEQLLVFLPRWVRNMFTRELTTAQLVVVWDGIFAVFFSEEFERYRRASFMVTHDDPSNTSLEPRGNFRSSVVRYAGSPEARESSDTTDVGGLKRRRRAFSRTVLGAAVAILLHLEDDLLMMDDDFSMLRRLTMTPILNPVVDALGLVNAAMSIAGTRPRGIVAIHRKPEWSAVRQHQVVEQQRWDSSHGGVDEPLTCSDRPSPGVYPNRLAAMAAATRMTKEELLMQQRSVALVVSNITDRLAALLQVNLETETATSHSHQDSSSTKMKGASAQHKGKKKTTLELSDDELSIARGALLELKCVSDRLSFF